MREFRNKGSEATVNDEVDFSLMLLLFALGRRYAESRKDFLYLPHGYHNHTPPQLLRIHFHILWVQIAERGQKGKGKTFQFITENQFSNQATYTPYNHRYSSMTYCYGILQINLCGKHCSFINNTSKKHILNGGNISWRILWWWVPEMTSTIRVTFYRNKLSG